MGFLLLGLDSLIAGIAISPLVNRWSHRLLLAALFGLADAIGFLVGVMVGAVSPLQMSDEIGESLELVLPALLGVYLILVALGIGRQRVAPVSWTVWVLPFILAIDNFGYGLAGDPAAGSLLQQAFGEQALSSALLALIGLLVGVVLPRVLPAIQRRAVAAATSGVGLVVVSGVLLMMEGLE